MALAEAARARSCWCCTPPRRASARWMWAAVTEGGLAAALDGAEVIYNLGADEVEIAAGPVRDLSGQPRRPGREPRRRHPAGRRLYRGKRAVRQHRGPPATGPPRRLCAGRGQGKLGDPAGACRPSWARRCPGTAWRRLRAALVAAHPHLGRIDEVPENDWPPLPVASPGKADFPQCGQGLLPDQPDCPGLSA